MIRLRDHCTPEKLEAHRTLDMVASGFDVNEYAIIRALQILGDA